MRPIVKKCIDARKAALGHVATSHVKLQPGNKKTGAQVWTVSLLPVVDCLNCSECQKKCYDLLHDVIIPSVLKDRARNSAIHKADKARYWNEVGLGCLLNGVRFLRINVGGDMTDRDFDYVAGLATSNPKTEFLFFTKNYSGIAAWIRKHGMMPGNVHAIVSRWPGMKCGNPYFLPEAHVRFRDGTTTAPHDAIECGGNCSECAETKNGCFGLARYQSVVFDEH